MMRAGRWIHILCMLMLPLGQHAALAHIAEHHAEAGSHAQHGGAEDADSRAPECEFDGLYAQVLGGASTAVCEPALFPGPDSRAFQARGSMRHSDLPAHRSRGPPYLS